MSTPLENLKAGTTAAVDGDLIEEIQSDLLPEFAILVQVEYATPF